MSVTGLIGFVISLLAIGFAWKNVTPYRLMISAFLLAFHIFSTYYYYLYSQTIVADASSYYFDPYGLYTDSFAFGTILVVNICHFLRYQWSATYLDCFILFQSVGFAGIMVMVHVFSDIETNISGTVRRNYIGLLFLPSVNFWTSAIGKDAPLFFGVSLCVFAMLNLRKRFLHFCIALGVMVLFRAHIALMAVMALGLATLFEGGIGRGRKFGLLALASVGFFLLIGPVKSTITVDVTDISSVSDFLQTRNNIYATVGGSTAMGNASFELRLISLLFRPFFFDAQGFLGVVASIENLGVVLAFIYMFARWRDLLLLVRRVFFVRFVLFYAVILLFGLVAVYYNVGLGLRERVMAYPMIFSLLVALWSMRQERKIQAVAGPRPSLMVGSNPNRALTEP